MRRSLLISLRMAVVTIVVTGLFYPLIVWGISAAVLPWKASGSLVTDANGTVLGSSLIAQPFTSPAYFHPRPSAAGPGGYDAMSSGASNLGPTSRLLSSTVARRVDDFRQANKTTVAVPVDAVTASCSGLDPDISPDNASAQVARVAHARGLSEARVRDIVSAHVAPRQFGLLGEPRVNVLELNLALDGISSK